MQLSKSSTTWSSRSRPASVGSLRWAAQALDREVFGFRFHYPIEVVQGAERPDSLHYYVYSDRLFLNDLEFDANGVAMKNYRTRGTQYNPLFVAWWGLFNLERHLRLKEDRWLQPFFSQVAWLKANAVERPGGSVVWPCYFEWQEGLCTLKSPWISAMYQGVVISALVRAYRLAGDKELLDLCVKATRVFSLSIDEGGVRTCEQGRVLYEEYPAYPLPRVLDGFLFSLLGLYDLAVQTNAADVRGLFQDGIEGLKQTLAFWDYRRKWSWYGSHGYLCPPHYHALNGLLLGILGRLTGDGTLTDCANRWDVNTRSVMDKMEIFLMFSLTKNWARLRLPRN